MIQNRISKIAPISKLIIPCTHTFILQSQGFASTISVDIVADMMSQLQLNMDSEVFQILHGTIKMKATCHWIGHIGVALHWFWSSYLVF